jgi:hypothetical protein
MMSKDVLRDRLARMLVEDAFALARTEIAFWDVHHIQKLVDPMDAAFFLASWPPIEGAALLNQMEPLIRVLLTQYIQQLLATPEDAKRLLTVKTSTAQAEQTMGSLFALLETVNKLGALIHEV